METLTTRVSFSVAWPLVRSDTGANDEGVVRDYCEEPLASIPRLSINRTALRRNRTSFTTSYLDSHPRDPRQPRESAPQAGRLLSSFLLFLLFSYQPKP